MVRVVRDVAGRFGGLGFAQDELRGAPFRSRLVPVSGSNDVGGSRALPTRRGQEFWDCASMVEFQMPKAMGWLSLGQSGGFQPSSWKIRGEKGKKRWGDLHSDLLPSSMASNVGISWTATLAAAIVFSISSFFPQFNPMTTLPWYIPESVVNLGPNVTVLGASAGLATIYAT